MVCVDFVASIARVAIVASTFFIVVFFPRLLFRRRSTLVAVVSSSATVSTIAVSAFWFIVVSVMAVASRSTLGVTASIVAASAI